MTAPRLVGIELYFDDVEGAKRFYRDTLGLELSDEVAERFAQFACGGGFVCLERRGSESYPSRDKAVLFIEVADLQAAIDRAGRDRIVHLEPVARRGRPPWAVVHDPEGHNIVMLQAVSRSG
jgi:predicted enzyme related to lactoylglutathione lyase